MSEPVTLLRDKVRDYYAAAARAAAAGQSACCGGEAFGAALYDDAADLPGPARGASLGCGNPTAVADLHAGEVVLDLGSGGGIDVLLSARRVGPEGKVYGLDMTPDMVDLARRNAAEARASNVELIQGNIEDIPLPDGSIDVIISNCVINLSGDKAAVFAEMHRVLRAGGRLAITDIVADDRLTPAERAALGSHEECIGGALSVSEYRNGLTAAGFTGIEIVIIHDVIEGMHSAIIRATPAT